MSGAKSSRIEFVDNLRGVAVIAMFFVHTAYAWVAPQHRDGAYWRWAMAVSGMVAPVFVFLAGVSVAMIAKWKMEEGRSARELKWSVGKRGLQILFIGYALHFAFYALSSMNGHWLRIFKVDILHCIGLSLFLIPGLAWPEPKRRFNWMAGLLFFVIPIFGWVTYRLPLETLLPTAIASYLTTKTPLAQFPLIPYGAWLALGLFIGPLWVRAVSHSGRETRFWYGLVAAAVLMFVAGKAVRWFYYSYSLHLSGLDLGVDDVQTRGQMHLFWFKASFVVMLFASARVLTASFDRRRFSPLLLFGRRSLWAYCVHLVIIYPFFGRFLSKTMNPWQHAISAVVLTAVMYYLMAIFGYLRTKREHVSKVGV